MNLSKKLLLPILISFSLLFTACTTQPEPANTTNKQIVVEEQPSAASGILVTALGYALGFVLASAIIK